MDASFNLKQILLSCDFFLQLRSKNRTPCRVYNDNNKLVFMNEEVHGADVIESLIK